jgi:hypothetical protein
MIWHKITDADSAPKDDREVVVRGIFKDLNILRHWILRWNKDEQRWSNGTKIDGLYFTKLTHWAEITPPEEEV